MINSDFQFVHISVNAVLVSHHVKYICCIGHEVCTLLSLVIVFKYYWVKHKRNIQSLWHLCLLQTHEIKSEIGILEETTHNNREGIFTQIQFNLFCPQYIRNLFGIISSYGGRNIASVAGRNVYLIGPHVNNTINK